jgi:hypothetical protein
MLIAILVLSACTFNEPVTVDVDLVFSDTVNWDMINGDTVNWDTVGEVHGDGWAWSGSVPIGEVHGDGWAWSGSIPITGTEVTTRTVNWD